jgi:hypothetical protein
MGRVCGTYGEKERFGWRELRKIDHLEDVGVDGRIILKWDWEALTY